MEPKYALRVGKSRKYGTEYARNAFVSFGQGRLSIDSTGDRGASLGTVKARQRGTCGRVSLPGRGGVLSPEPQPGWGLAAPAFVPISDPFLGTTISLSSYNLQATMLRAFGRHGNAERQDCPDRTRPRPMLDPPQGAMHLTGDVVVNISLYLVDSTMYCWHSFTLRDLYSAPECRI